MLSLHPVRCRQNVKNGGDIKMGIIVLIIAAAVEIAFGVYCITTESSQRRIRNYIRIGSLATLIILSVVSVIQWGFQ